MKGMFPAKRTRSLINAVLILRFCTALSFFTALSLYQTIAFVLIAFKMVAASSLSILTLVGLAFAHPGHEDHVTDIAVKRSFLEKSRRSLENCAAQLEARGTLKAAEKSRARFLNDLRKKSLGESKAFSNSENEPKLTTQFQIASLQPPSTRHRLRRQQNPLPRPGHRCHPNYRPHPLLHQQQNLHPLPRGRNRPLLGLWRAKPHRHRRLRTRCHKLHARAIHQHCDLQSAASSLVGCLERQQHRCILWCARLQQRERGRCV